MGTSDWDSNSFIALALTKVLTNLKYSGVYLSYFVIFQWQEHTGICHSYYPVFRYVTRDCCLLPGGKKWTCDFSHPVVGEKCKVQIKKHRIILKAKKRDPGLWKDLRVSNWGTRQD